MRVITQNSTGQPSLRWLIHEILRLSDPEKIFLLSAAYYYQLTEDFTRPPQHPELKSGNYHLLVLLGSDGSETNSRNARLKTKMDILYPQLTLTVANIHKFNADLRSGNLEALETVRKGMLWYDKGEIPLVLEEIPFELGEIVR